MLQAYGKGRGAGERLSCKDRIAVLLLENASQPTRRYRTDEQQEETVMVGMEIIPIKGGWH